LPDGTLMLGGHEHLTFLHAAGRTRYLHLGAWNRAIGVVSISQTAGRPDYETRLVAIDRRGPGDPELANELEGLRRKHLTEQDRTPLARLAAPISLNDAAQVLVRAMARAAGADIAAISHTTLGDGLPAGEVTAADLAAFIRFDGGLVRGELDADAMAALLARANQEGEPGLGNRTGDFVHANVEPLAAGRRYRFATIGWVRQNAMRYLGSDSIAFEPVPDRQLREIMLKALNERG
jgi:2',3'-cyclic-nucleotide 2'-phosphodiesterase (5'-nucleotidase family)